MASEIKYKKYKTKAGEERWQYRFEIASVGGVRKWHTKFGFKSKADAQSAGKIAQHQYDTTGRIIEPSKISYSDFLDEWFNSLIKIKATTKNNYKKKIENYIKPHLGHYRLKAITNDNINSLLVTLAESGSKSSNKGLSKNTLSSIKGVITNSFNYAYKKGYIQDNPVLTGIEIPLIEEDQTKDKRFSSEHPHVFLKQDQIDKIFARFDEESSVFLPMMFGYHCGLRIGEAFCVCWEDIDFNNKTLSINKQVQWHENSDKLNKNDPKKRKPMFDQSEIESSYWYITTPKYNSVRTIELSDTMISYLIRAKERQDKCKEIFPIYDGKSHKNHYHYYHVGENNKIMLSDNTYSGENLNFVCTRITGEWIIPRTMQHTSRVIHNDLSIPEFTFHSFRHTHASILAQNGAPPSFVQNRLGHKNLDVTINIYYKYTELMQEQGRIKLNEIF